MKLWLAGALMAGAAAVGFVPADVRGEDWEDVLEDRREFLEERREAEREYWEDRREAEREYWERMRDRRDDWWDDDRRWRRDRRPFLGYGRPYGYHQPYYSDFRFGPAYGGWGYGRPYGYHNNYYRPWDDGFRFYLGW